MSKEIKDILSIYENILSSKNVIKEASLFGGNTFKWGGGPSDHASRKLGNWQSDSSWDIMAAEGIPVYSISDGTISKVGGELKLSNNGSVYGLSVTVNTGNDEIFYTHLGSLSPNMSQGQKINKGDLIGNIGKPAENPNWPTHVHIGIKSGDIKQYINNEGEITGAENVANNSGSSGSSGTTNKPVGKYDIDPGNDPLVKNAATKAFGNLYNPQGLKEQRTTKSKFYLQFCGISDPSVKNGQQISVGQLLGKTTEDVIVSKFDETYYRENITKKDFDLGKNIKVNLGTLIIPKDSNEKIKSPVAGVVNNTKYFEACKNPITIECYVEGKKALEPEKKKFGSERTYSDPLMAAIVTAPFKLFQNKYNKDTGELEQKRFGRPGDGRPVDPWIKDAITAPFKKIGNIFKKNQNEEDERKVKKVNENIDRIKKLL